MAVPFVITSVLPTFRARHPRLEVGVDIEDRFVDIVAEGYDAGVRLSKAIECRDRLRFGRDPCLYARRVRNLLEREDGTLDWDEIPIAPLPAGATN
jgi:DNA-binding transcriptional LysR family regulator